LCPTYRAGSQINLAQRQQRFINVRELIFGPKGFEVGKHSEEAATPDGFYDEPLPIAVDHHAVTRQFEIRRDADGLALVVAKEFGFAARNVILGLGHVDLLCICTNIYIVEA
jgi:hypothetical protein